MFWAMSVSRPWWQMSPSVLRIKGLCVDRSRLLLPVHHLVLTARQTNSWSLLGYIYHPSRECSSGQNFTSSSKHLNYVSSIPPGWLGHCKYHQDEMNLHVKSRKMATVWFSDLLSPVLYFWSNSESMLKLQMAPYHINPPLFINFQVVSL
jgi:hypothetical protein